MGGSNAFASFELALRPSARRLIHRIHHLVRAGTEPVSLASICWACGKMSYLNLTLFDDMATRMLSEGVGSMDCQECANVFWAHAMLLGCSFF